MAFYDGAIQAGADDADIDPHLLKTVGMLESSLGRNVGRSLPNDPDSPVGFWQTRPSTARAMLGRDPKTLDEEAVASARYLREGLEATGTPQGALAYYFAGPDRAGWGPKTAAYVAKGQAYYQNLPRSAPSPSAPPAAAAAVPSKAAADPHVEAGQQLYEQLTGAAARTTPAAPSLSTVPAEDDPHVSAGRELYEQLAKPTAPPAPAAPAAPEAAVAQSVDEFGRPYEARPNDLGAVGRVAGAATTAAVAGAAGGAAALALPDGTDLMRRLGVFPPAAGGGTPLQSLNEGASNAVSPYVSGAARLLGGAGGALLGAYQGGVSQAGQELENTAPGQAMARVGLGPSQLGRDLAAMPEAFPAGLSRGVPEPPAVAPNRLALLPQEARAAASAAALDASAAANGWRPRALGEPIATGQAVAIGEDGRQMVRIGSGADAAPPNRLLGPQPGMGGAQAGPAPEAATAAAANGWRPMQQGEPVAQGQEVATGADGQQWVRTEAPAPNSVGAAATPATLSNMSPAEQAANQARAEQYRLANPRTTANGEDRTHYVPGVVPTRAEITGNPADASWEKFYANQVDTKDRFLRRQAENDAARVDHFNESAGDAKTLSTAVEARDVQAQRDLDAAWRGKTQADAQPVVTQVDAILAGPAGKETAVEKALSQVRSKLFDSEGRLETDPEILYGVRKEVTNLLGKNAQMEQPTLRNAARQLSALKDTLDGQIELAAPGFRRYLDNYSNASRPIDSMQLLQDALPNLQVGAGKGFTFNTFNKFMKGVVEDRQAPGVNPAKSIDDATMDRLWNIYADLHRQQTATNLGTVRGSPTQPWMAQAGSLAVEGLGHAALAHLSGFNPLAHIALSSGAMATKNALIGRKARTQVNRLLDASDLQPTE